ncbi:MAG: hypothetical protein WAM66_06845 [Acidobacteriaceae bacterium]
MFEQAVLAVQDEKTFAEVRAVLDAVFAPKQVKQFLRKVQKSKLRIREFEKVLARGLLGAETPAKYAVLGNSDRGQVREHYLSSVEKVDPALRAKYLKLYSYY